MHYQGGSAPPVDILWVVDNSGSMQEEQAKLANNFTSFIQYFTALNLDFHMAVVTSDVEAPADSGKFRGTIKVLTPTTPDLNATFISNVSVGIGGSGKERGLEAARLALTEPNLSGPNVGFLRPDAILAIIIVSDEEDGDEWPTAVPPVDEYVNFFRALKGNDPSKINLSVIVGDIPLGCQSADADAEAGTRYHAAATALNGVIASICASDFGPVLDELGSVIAGLVSAFPTDYTPVVESIKVFVDGVEVPNDPLNGWTWNPSLGGIAFAPSAVPPECAIVEITYQVLDYGGDIQPNNELPPEQCSILAITGGSSLDGGAFQCSASLPSPSTTGLSGGLLALAAMFLMLASRRRRI